MEEARIAFLKQIGFPMEKIEADGIVSPVVNVSCDYKKMSYFADVLCIRVTVKEYRGVKLILGYEMTETRKLYSYRYLKVTTNVRYTWSKNKSLGDGWELIETKEVNM